MKAANRKLAYISLGVVLVTAFVAGLLVWILTRPEDLPITARVQDRSELDLVQFGQLSDDSGIVTVESFFLLDQPDNSTTYSVAINITDLPEDIAEADFYFLKNPSTTEVTEPNYKVANVQDMDKFPLELSATEFDASEFSSGILVEAGTTDVVLATLEYSFNNLEEDDTPSEDTPAATPEDSVLLTAMLEGNGMAVVKGSISLAYVNELIDGEVTRKAVLQFENIVVPSAPGPFLYLSKRSGPPQDLVAEDILIPIEGGADNGGFTVEGSFTQDLDPSIDVSLFENGSWIVWCDPLGVYLGGGNIGGDSTSVEDAMMNESPEAPQEEDMPESNLPVLASELFGNRYNVRGTITITYVNELVNGQVQQKPVLRFKDIEPPSAPGPFLYLSKRPGAPRDIVNEDRLLRIDGGADNGGFTVEGSFTMDLPDDINPRDYEGGSWIVWCDPFRVYLGGGEIIVTEYI